MESRQRARLVIGGICRDIGQCTGDLMALSKRWSVYSLCDVIECPIFRWCDRRTYWFTHVFK